MSKVITRSWCWLPYVFSLVYFLCVGLVVNKLNYAQDLLVWAVAMVPLFLSYRSWSILLEISTIPLVWLFLTPYVSRQGAMWYIPLVASVVFLVSHKLRSHFATIFAFTFVAAWVTYAIISNSLGLIEFIFLSTTFIWVTVYILQIMRRTPPPTFRKIDVILCSFSGNTGHYAQNFIDALPGDVKVVVHRFHRYEEFNPVFDGDALVLAFPVSGWKAPWPLTEYLLKTLPKGKGKPAFILYTCAGGPENAGFLVGVLMALKGYRVIGRLWSIYPLNVPTFRLGSKRLWRVIDSLTPFKSEIQLVKNASKEFAAAGGRPGFPFLLWPTPLVLIGIIFDNRWINKFLYRTYVWRRRCIKCNFCVKYCPVNRFNTKTGIPKAKGTCSLCFGCVNHCPTNAMQMRFWTEYGQQYKPRWPEFIVKK